MNCWHLARACAPILAKIAIATAPTRGSRLGSVRNPGLPDKARAHLFEAFQGSSRQGGTGLGLVIAAELTRAHGGNTHLVDGTIGATFRIAIADRAVDIGAHRPERARA